jgi:acyl carrier protein
VTEPTEALVRRIVADLAELDESSLSADTTFREAGIDSLLAMEIAVHVENAAGVEFGENDLKDVTTVGGLVALTQRHLG